MLRSAQTLKHYKVDASDGIVGRVLRFLFDDERWVVYYLVVQTEARPFLGGRRLLVSPNGLGKLDWAARRLHLAMTMDGIKDSPVLNVDAPQAGAHDRRPRYDARSIGAPVFLPAGDDPVEDAAVYDVRLRSDSEIRGYPVHGTDGPIGHVRDVIVDDRTWDVRYLVLNTGAFWFGRHVLIPPQWASHFSWAEKKLFVGLSRQAVRDSPRWDETEGIGRGYEARLCEHYGQPAYWLGTPTTGASSSPSTRRAG